MMVHRLADWRRVLVLGFLSVLGAVAVADTSTSKTVDGVTVYVGIAPAEMVRGHPTEHPESTMHDGIPKASGEYHVTIALFDSKTGQRITDASVKARVEPLGMAGEEKTLEPMTIANTITYGNYFKMVGSGPFRIKVQIQKRNSAQTIATQFEHKHP